MTTPIRHELVQRVRAAWPVHSAGHGRHDLAGASIPDGSVAAALVDLAVDTVLDALAGRAEPREHPMPGNVLVHVQGMGGDSAANPDDQVAGEIRTPTDDLDHAMLLTSDTGRVEYGDALHKAVLDLDMPARLLPSSTPGHHHLLIDRLIPWDVYLELLRALARAGLFESGYVGAAERRGHTAVRLPWLRKGDQAPPPPPGAELIADRAHARAAAARSAAEQGDEVPVDPWARAAS